MARAHITVIKGKHATGKTLVAQSIARAMARLTAEVLVVDSSDANGMARCFVYPRGWGKHDDFPADFKLTLQELSSPQWVGLSQYAEIILVQGEDFAPMIEPDFVITTSRPASE